MKKSLVAILLLSLIVGCGESEQGEKQPSADPVAALENLGATIKRNGQDEVVELDVSLNANFPESMTDAGLKRLTGWTTLQKLNLEWCTITNAGLAELKGLANLQTLNIGGTDPDQAVATYREGIDYLKEHGGDGIGRLYVRLCTIAVKSDPKHAAATAREGIEFLGVGFLEKEISELDDDSSTKQLFSFLLME